MSTELDRLRAVFLVPLLLLVAFFAGILWSPRADRDPAVDADRNAHRGLALRIAEAEHARLVREDGTVDAAALEEVQRGVSVAFPGSRLYVVDLRGEILARGDGGELARGRIALAPVRAFLDQERHAASERSPETRPTETILGDDPRKPGTSVAFSVSPLPPSGPPVGYLYSVLPRGSGPFAAAELAPAAPLRSPAGIGLASAVIFAVGLWVSYTGIRPLRRLAARLEQLSTEGEASTPAGKALGPELGREIHRLEKGLDTLAEHHRRHLEEAKHIDLLRSELLANVSHDLRTPIATLRGYLETLALGDAGLSPAGRAEYLAIALRHAERLGRLVDELLELSKLDSHAVAPNLERFRIGELIQDNVQRFRLRARQKGVDLRAEPSPDLPAVKADVGLMERAFENLIDNALRHTPAGGSVTVRLRAAADGVRVEVEDTGTGIRPEDLPRIFDRFFSSTRNRSTGELAAPGSGLGLAITRRIVELHGSELRVESRVGKGSRFSFDLPAAPSTRTGRTLERVTRRTQEWLQALGRSGTLRRSDAPAG